MLDRIIRGCLQHRALVLVGALLVAVLGFVRGAGMPIDVLPDLNRPTVTIVSDLPGMVPHDVEIRVSRPIEQVMNGAPGAFRVRSSSLAGLSVVQVEFGWGSDPYRVRQIVGEKLQLVRAQLPPLCEPTMAPMASIMGQIQLVGFRSTKLDATTLRRLVDRDIVPRVRALGGIAQVVTMGGQRTELQVAVDAERLRAHGITLPEVDAAVRAANVSAAGGTLPIGARGPMVAVPGRVRTERDLQQAVVRDVGARPVRVADVADVSLGPATVRVGEAGIDGGPGVILVVTKQPDADTVTLTDRIATELAQLRRELPDDVEILPELFQQAAFIHRAVDNVLTAVRDGALFVVVVLFLFLFNLRTTLVTLTAIPLSLAVTAIVFAALGMSINTMTLGGLAVAIGVLVDDAIVDVENVYRRLHENARRPIPQPILDVVFHACSEVRRPVLYGTLLVTVVYVPLFFLSGIEGRLFAPIGFAYIVSVLASLLVALTVTPVLCFLLLGHSESRSAEYGGRLVAWLRAGAARVAAFSVARTGPLTAMASGLCLCALFAMATRGASFLPPFNEGSAQVNLMLPPDTSLAASDAVGQRLERMLTRVPGIRSVARRTGRAEGDEHIMPVSVTEAIVTFDAASPRGRDEIVEDVRQRLRADFPGVASEIEQPLAHLLSHLLSGVTAQVAIKITGPELTTLRRLAREVEGAVRPVAGVRDLYTEAQVLVDQVRVEPRREALARLGVAVRDVTDVVGGAFGGDVAGDVLIDGVDVPVRVMLQASDRSSVAQVGGLLVRRPDGGLVRVGDVADVAVSRTPNAISRENAQRQIVVQHNVGGRSLSAAVADVERALAPIRDELARMQGYGLRVSGQFEAQQEATRTIGWLSLAALGVMVGILVLHFHSLAIAALLLVTRPLAFSGAAVWVSITGQDLSVATLVGLIALLGMSARNAILLVDHTLHLLREEGESLTPGVVVRAARERVVPVLMTALTSGIGLVPLVLAAEQPGREILYPVATVILGGLVTSTLLDFLVMPGLLWRARSALERVR
ncbi:MAG: efflux RND transporter permease subunit [Planctomycetota bacterium]